MRIFGDQRNTNLIERHRRDIDLESMAPVNFHIGGPGGNTVMLSETKTALFPHNLVEAGLFTHGGFLAIGAYNQVCRNAAAVEAHLAALSVQVFDVPQHSDAQRLGARNQNLMQLHAPEPAAHAVREISGY